MRSRSLSIACARRAVALLDVLLATALLAVLAAIAIPSIRPDDSLKLIGASVLMTADLEYAQSASLATPSDPTLVRFDADAERYWLALASSPETPIPRPGGGLYEVTLGGAGAEQLDGVGLALEGVTNSTIRFDAFGRLDQPADAQVVFSASTGSLRVRVAASTGSVFLDP